MKYNGFYYALFQGTMKKVLTEHYGKSFAADTMRRAKGVYKKLVLEADEMGAGKHSIKKLSWLTENGTRRKRNGTILLPSKWTSRGSLMICKRKPHRVYDYPG